MVLRNGEAADAREIPVLGVAEFRRRVIEEVARGAQIAALFGRPLDGSVHLYALLTHPLNGTLSISSASARDGYPALTPECPQAHWFEREIYEQWRVEPHEHPWLKPIRFHGPYRGEADGDVLPGVTDYFAMRGAEVHEVDVGPVHAGIIEPGHFRFQCHGETVFHLEISLGYQHRGVEQALLGGPTRRTMHLMETLAGDTTIGHATAYAEVMEGLAGARVPPRAASIRGLALELERLANHTGDLGALAGDVGYLPTQSFCGRLRGEFLNLTALLCGSRFGRGVVRPGGAGFDLDEGRAAQVVERTAEALRDATVAANLLWNSPSVMSRFEGTGTVPRETALELGLVGPAARACGIERDARQDFPSGIFRFSHIPISTGASGDVYARAYVRWLEIQRSAAFVRETAGVLPRGALRRECGAPRPHCVCASLGEGWRGEICHVAITGPDGRFAAYKVVDPSFHNWMGLAMALRGQQISDFPLCNKSFNLSYCGHDL